jgi:hypothetical protein
LNKEHPAFFWELGMSSADQMPPEWPLGLNDPGELELWCERFGVTPEELKAATDFAGHQFKDVEFYLCTQQRA